MTVTLNPTPELVQIQDAARAMLAHNYSLDRLHQDTPDPMGPLAEFGTFIFGLPEDHGGAGFTLADEAALHVELGKHLISPTAIAHVIAARIAADAGLDQIVAQLEDPETAICFGAADENSALFFTGTEPKLAVVNTGGQLILAGLQGVSVSPATFLGGANRIYRADTTNGAEIHATASPEICNTHQLLAAAQLLGVAEVTLDLAVDYAKTREQFGRPIGSFQAIKHHCADMAIRCQALSALLDLTAATLDSGAEEAAHNLAALATLAPRHALDNARMAIQIHGGLGFSAEAMPHYYMKHAHLLAALMLPADICATTGPI